MTFINPELCPFILSKLLIVLLVSLLSMSSRLLPQIKGLNDPVCSRNVLSKDKISPKGESFSNLACTFLIQYTGENEAKFKVKKSLNGQLFF